MASAYRNAGRMSDESESDEVMSDFDENEASSASEADSATDSEEDASSSPVAKLVQLPTELRNRILMLTSRGVSHRQRHLINDLSALLPHTKRDTKLDTKSNNNYNESLNALAELQSCNYIFFLEARKHAQDLYLWLASAPNGPTIKFSVSNVHTMAELGFEGNVLKGGRGIVVFDKSFDGVVQGEEVRGLMREMLRGVFCVPGKGVRGMKPFIDRVTGIYGLDGKIWIRVYEVRDSKDKNQADTIEGGPTLFEVGPRLVLTPVLVQEGSFGGPIIYQNSLFVSGNQIRKEARVQKAGKYAAKRNQVEEKAVKLKALGLDSGTQRPKSAVHNNVLFG